MAEDGFDYSTLAREGEVKKTKPNALTPQAAKPGEGGDYLMAKPAREPDHPSNLPPEGGIIQRRRRGNATPPIPSGEQESFDGARVRTNFTRRGRTPLNGLDKYIQATLDNGGHEPDEATRRKAIKYLHGRSSGIVRSAEERLRRKKPPTEH